MKNGVRIVFTSIFLVSGMVINSLDGYGAIKTIYVAPMSHLDIGFTAPPSVVARQMVEVADKVLEQAEADGDYVWNFETFWQLERWLESNPPEDKIKRLLELVKAGRLYIGGSYLNPHSSLMSSWALDQLFRIPTSWAKGKGLEMKTAILLDVPGHPIDTPRFLLKNGIRYLVVGANLSMSPKMPEKIARTPFWWEAPTGERVLTWISDKGYTEAFSVGIDPESALFFHPDRRREGDPMEVMEKGIKELIEDYERKGYEYDAVLLLHAFDNWGPEASFRLPKYARMWNQTHDSPKIRVATVQEFFEYIDGKYGDRLPVYRGGFGGMWEGTRASIPTAVRLARKAEEILRGKPDPMLVEKLLVFWEHSFGGGGPWPGLMSREEAIEHNMEQFELLSSLLKGVGLEEELGGRKGREGVRKGEGLEGPVDIPKHGGLYLVDKYPMVVWPQKLYPLDRWVEAKEERKDGSRTYVSYRINRIGIPREGFVVLAWELGPEPAGSKVKNRTATGWEVLPDDRLGGYDPCNGWWISPFGFRVGGFEIKGDGIPAFRKEEIGGKAWLIGLCLTSGLVHAEFKGGEKGILDFDKAWPWEDPVVEIGIEVKRTNPEEDIKVSKQPNGWKPVPPPDGAIVLFDGKDLSEWVHGDGRPASWNLVDGAMEVRVGSGDIRTRSIFKDFQLHVEFWLPLMPNARGQARANSGVFLPGDYEIQVLDSYDNRTYARGECGAIYGIRSPDVNAALPPENWQTYDIIFRGARFDEQGRKVKKGRITVFWNGIKVHDGVEVDRPEGDQRGYIRLQDHGCRVRYRNIWIMPLEPET
jgi:hypothetical protein